MLKKLFRKIFPKKRWHQVYLDKKWIGRFQSINGYCWIELPTLAEEMSGQLLVIPGVDKLAIAYKEEQRRPSEICLNEKDNHSSNF